MHARVHARSGAERVRCGAEDSALFFESDFGIGGTCFVSEDARYRDRLEAAIAEKSKYFV